MYANDNKLQDPSVLLTIPLLYGSGNEETFRLPARSYMLISTACTLRYFCNGLLQLVTVRRDRIFLSHHQKQQYHLLNFSLHSALPVWYG